MPGSNNLYHKACGHDQALAKACAPSPFAEVASFNLSGHVARLDKHGCESGSVSTPASVPIPFTTLATFTASSGPVAL